MKKLHISYAHLGHSCVFRIERSLSLLYAMRNYLLFYIVLKGLHPVSRMIVIAVQETKIRKNSKKISQTPVNYNISFLSEFMQHKILNLFSKQLHFFLA